MKLWLINTEWLQIYTYCYMLVYADTKAAPNHCAIRLLSQWQNGLIISTPLLWWMLAADVAAVANAPCVGLIMEMDSNKTAKQRTAQTGKRRVCVCHFIWGWELCAVLMGVVLKRCLVRPRGQALCTMCGLQMLGLCRIICEQVD